MAFTDSYWIDSIAAVLDDAGVACTREQLLKVAAGAKDVACMEGEATGRLCIPNPLESEVRALQQKVKEAEAATDKQRADFVKNICMRRNCTPAEVELEGDGHATVYRGAR